VCGQCHTMGGQLPTWATCTKLLWKLDVPSLIFFSKICSYRLSFRGLRLSTAGYLSITAYRSSLIFFYWMHRCFKQNKRAFLVL
jgi:hypothetical protein